MKIHRHSCAYFVLLALGLLTAGCENQSASTPAATPPKQPEFAQKPKAEKRSAPVAVTQTIEPAKVEEEPKQPAASGATRVEMEEEKELPPERDPPIPDSFKPLNKDKTLFFEKDPDGKRRVHILSEVCLREGPLEVLLCKQNTKEHESIVHADIDAREIHTALVVAGAKFGSTVRFVPQYKPATGDTIKVSVTYYKDGKLLTKPAQYWIQHLRNKKDMEHDWVFAGSRFFKAPDDPDKPPFYCANNGEVISIANFTDSMLDLPVMSSKEQAELGFVAHTDRIPPLKTKVIVTLEPVPAAKK